MLNSWEKVDIFKTYFFRLDIAFNQFFKIVRTTEALWVRPYRSRFQSMSETATAFWSISLKICSNWGPPFIKIFGGPK